MFRVCGIFYSNTHVIFPQFWLLWTLQLALFYAHVWIPILVTHFTCAYYTATFVFAG